MELSTRCPSRVGIGEGRQVKGKGQQGAERLILEHATVCSRDTGVCESSVTIQGPCRSADGLDGSDLWGASP